MATGNEAANKGLRVLAGRPSAKHETPGGALPASFADVLAVPAEVLEMVAGELEMQAADLAREYANAASLLGAVNARLEQEGGE